MFNDQHAHTDIAFAFITDRLPTNKINPDESSDIRTFTKAQLLKLPDEQTAKNVRETYVFILEEALKHWELVPTDAFKTEL